MYQVLTHLVMNWASSRPITDGIEGNALKCMVARASSRKEEICGPIGVEFEAFRMDTGERGALH